MQGIIKLIFCLIYKGSAYGTRENMKFTFTGPVNLRAGTNKIALLSVAVGLPVSFFAIFLLPDTSLLLFVYVNCSVQVNSVTDLIAFF